MNKIHHFITKQKFEYKISIIYSIVGFSWIIFSDSISGMLFNDVHALTSVNIIKGIFYVTITGLLLYYIVKKHVDKLRKTELELTKAKEKAEENKEKYRISEERFRLTLEATQIGLWDWNIKDDIWYASPVYYTMLGYEPKETYANREEWIEKVHPDDVNEVIAKIQNVLTRNFNSYQYEARIKHANGNYRWQKVIGFGIERDTDGKVSRMIGIRMDIHDLKQAQEFLLLSEYDLKEAQRLAQIGNWDWNSITDTIRWSEEYYHICGFDPKYTPPGYKEHLKAYTSESAERIDIAVKHTMETGEPYELDLEQLRSDGKQHWITARGEVKRDTGGKIIGLRGTAQDITERKLAEERLQKSDREKTIMNKIASIFLTIPDEDMYNEVLSIVLELTNSKFGLFGFIDESGDLVIPSLTKDIWNDCNVEGKSIVFLASTWGNSIWGQAIRQRKTIVSNGPFHIPEGHIAIDNFISVPILFGDKTIGLLSFANKKNSFSQDDINILDNIARFISPILNARLQRDRNELKRKQTELELINSKEKAEESDRLKSAFLNNISHEIRTPMNAIIGFSGFLSDPLLPEEKRKNFTSIIKNSCNQLLSVVTDLITISSIETKQEKINLSKVCINHLIIELHTIFKEQAKNHKTTIYSRQSLSDKESEIYTDKTKLTQILSNLISNSIKFTHEGKIEIGYQLKNDELEFYVKDTGMGIKKEFHEKIFERFRQADESINKQYGGTGIGLSISKGFVELLGGKIWVESEYGKGSVFYFTLPYKQANQDNNTEAVVTIQSNDCKTILVGEDDENNFLYMEEILTQLGLNIIRAKDGKEIIELYKANPNISLILMDIKMPVLSGFEAAKIIKELKPDMPIIAQSAYALEHEKAKYEVTFNDYLTKPLDKKELTRKISQYINI